MSALILTAIGVGLLLAIPTDSLAAQPREAAKQPAMSTPHPPWSVTYRDGSANGYRFWREAKSRSAQYEYTPVRKEESSSGLYSGGKPAKGRLDAKQSAELWQRVRKLEADKPHHATVREMGTGAFKVKEASREREFLVKTGAALKEFDSFVAAFYVGR